jgi:hypothetical protein
MNYELYQSDNVTPIAIAQPGHATWEDAELGTFASGSPRLSRYRTVRWVYAELSAAEYGVFIANRPASGVMTFKTFRPAVGGSPASYVKVSGIMAPPNTGRFTDGYYHNVDIVWTRVETV